MDTLQIKKVGTRTSKLPTGSSTESYANRCSEKIERTIKCNARTHSDIEYQLDDIVYYKGPMKCNCKDQVKW